MLELTKLDVTSVLAVFVFSLYICWSIHNWIRSRSYPPGPIGLPLIGYYPFLGTKPNLTFEKLGKKYGDIFSYYTGPQLITVVNDFYLAKEILNCPQTLDRPVEAFDLILGRGGFGGMNGEPWLEQRRFVIHTMRNLGLGKGLWESMIQEHASDFVETLKQSNGKPIFYEDMLAFSKVNNSLALLIGRTLDPKADKEDIEVLKAFSRKMASNFSSVNIIVLLPWIQKLAKLLNPPSLKEMMVAMGRIEHIFRREISNRQNSDANSTRDDFIDIYLQEMEKRKAEDNNTYTMDTFLGNLFILFSAGQDSTVISLSWLILLMAHFTDVQKRVKDEIDHVLGRDGTVGFEDKQKLPYCMATIFEMFRWASISAVFPPRSVSETFDFHGYTLPQGSLVICNNWAMSHNPKHFQDPMDFKPERFLSPDGQKVIKKDGYGAFSFGKRNCPGEGIAFNTVFLYFVILMQKFRVQPPCGAEVDLDYTFGSGVMPNPQEMCFHER